MLREYLLICTLRIVSNSDNTQNESKLPIFCYNLTCLSLTLYYKLLWWLRAAFARQTVNSQTHYFFPNPAVAGGGGEPWIPVPYDVIHAVRSGTLSTVCSPRRHCRFNTSFFLWHVAIAAPDRPESPLAAGVTVGAALAAATG
jgi:hypothetical protein